MDAKQYKDGDIIDVIGSVFKNIKESWQAVQLNLTTFVVLALVPAALAMIVMIMALIPAISGTDAGTASAIFLAAVGLFVVFVIALMIAPAITLTQLDSVVGKKKEAKDAFDDGKKFVLRYIALGILYLLAVIVGTILFIIPGILAIFFFSLSPYILIDKNVSAVDAMKHSYELTKEYWKPVLGLVIVNIAVSAVGSFPLVGWIVSLVLTVAYFCLAPYVYSVIAGKKVIKVA